MTLKRSINSSKEYKHCSKCGELKHISEYNKCIDGYQNYCRECQKAYRDNKKGNYLYFIYQNDNIKYIGSTNFYKARLSSHLNGYTQIASYIKDGLWDRIEVLEIEEDLSRHELYVLEQLFIDEVVPCWNKGRTINYDNVDYDTFDYLSILAYDYMQTFDMLSFTYITNKAKIRVDGDLKSITSNKKSLNVGSK